MHKLLNCLRTLPLVCSVGLVGACQAAPAPTRSPEPSALEERDGTSASQPTSGATASGFDAESFRRPSQSELKQRLNALQFEVTQRDGTEPPFRNTYWDNKAEGIYVDVVSGEPLFSSRDKFASGTGWPSFTRPLDAKNIVERQDRALGMVRTEVRSKHADSHLGHLFNDGPAPTGLRYCINSAALRFVPRERLAEQGYGALLSGF